MAKRPVFISTDNPGWRVIPFETEFVWSAGLAKSQKKKNVVALAQAFARRRNVSADDVLEISSCGMLELGIKLSAFNLLLDIECLCASLEKRAANGVKLITVEAVYQGSKVTVSGGPYTDIYDMSSKDAKRDERIRKPLKGFKLGEVNFPMNPQTLFYNFLYCTALHQEQNKALVEELVKYKYFTDINFNPNKGISNQAHACALFTSLYRSGELDKALESVEAFSKIAYNIK